MAKGSMLSSVGGYFSGVYKEGKKVRWAAAQEVFKSTVVVLGYVIFMAVVFYVANLFIVKMFGILGINM